MFFSNVFCSLDKWTVLVSSRIWLDFVHMEGTLVCQTIIPCYINKTKLKNINTRHADTFGSKSARHNTIERQVCNINERNVTNHHTVQQEIFKGKNFHEIAFFSFSCDLIFKE